MAFDPREVGGASDGNILAAAGLPVLDGLGASGGGAHAEHEHVLVDDIPARIALLAGLLGGSLSRQGRQRAATSPASAASGTSSTRRRSATYIASSVTSSGSGTASSRTGAPGR